MSDTFLDRIAASARADLAERRALTPLEELRMQASCAPAPRPFAAALRPTPRGSARLVAEVKHASPSKGVIAATFDPVAQARAYQQGDASAISVLTEPQHFLGSLDHLRAVRAAVHVPVLRKDFIFDPYQVYEARAAGADALLLICALLADAELASLLALTRSLGMEALVEAHDATEVRRAVALDATVIGVNSRDLRTFEVHADVVKHLRPLVPPDRIFVAESGIATATDAVRARAWGADAILVGEALMRADDPVAKARAFATAPGGETAEFFRSTRDALSIKLCGLMTPEQGEIAIEVGASVVGLVFYPPSHRHVTPERACQIASMANASGMLAAGVFVNEPLDTMLHFQRACHLSAIQLGGDETPARCADLFRHLHMPIIKSLRLRDEADLARLDAYAMAGAILLLDAHVPGSYGGTGKTGDWDLARRAAQRWPIILSGGLTSENVAGAIATVHPRGVDVSSGIETDKVKDPDKMRAFVTAARTASDKEG